MDCSSGAHRVLLAGAKAEKRTIKRVQIQMEFGLKANHEFELGAEPTNFFYLCISAFACPASACRLALRAAQVFSAIP